MYKSEHKKLIIAAYCELGGRVGRYLKHQFAYDCFCVKGGESPSAELHFQYEQEIIQFISDAIDEKMAREPNPVSWKDELK